MLINPYRFAPAGDPYWQNVVLLMGGNTTPLVDESPSPKTVTTSGTAGSVTTESKFGQGSIFVNDTANYINIASSSALNLTANYTIEFWLKTGSQTKPYPSLIASAATSWGVGTGAVSVQISHSAYLNKIALYANGNETAIVFSTSNVTNSTWNFCAICRSGSTTRLHLNGIQESINTTRTDALSFATNATRIGVDQWNGNNGGLQNAYIDEIRITNAARPEYLGATSPVPAAAFPRF